MNTPRTNEYGQPIGPALADWSARPAPPATPMAGRYCRLEPVDTARHAQSLYAAFSAAPDGRDWTYMSAGPFADSAKFDAHMARIADSVDPQHHAIIDTRSGDAVGAIHLLMQRVFDDLGYRRFEWKCDDLNAPSRAAALRLGFTFEGIFRQAIVYKGRSRDTAWFSMTDGEWLRMRNAYAQWLAPGNFDAAGQQRRRLGELIAEARAA